LDVGVTVDLVLGVNVTATSESPVLDQVAVDTAAAGTTGGQPDGTYDPDTSNNSDMDVVTPVNQVDVALTQSATTPVTAGGTVTYTLTVTNNSTASPATDVFWSDVIPANVTVGTFGITSPSSGYTVPSTANACSYSGSEVDCVLGTLPASAVVTSTFTVTTASTTPNPAAATATAYLDQVDTAPANNTAGASTVVNGGTTPPAVTISGPTSVDESSTAARGYSWTASYSSAIASGQVTTSCGDAGTKVAGSDSTFTAAATVAGTFSCLFDDGSAGLTSAPSATVTMPIGTSGSSISGAASAAVSVANVAPTATLAVPTSLATGAPFTLSLAGPSDPSATDTTAGFTYAFDCGTGALGDFGPAASATCAAPSAGGQLQVRGAVEDKDGGVSTYSATVTVTGPAVAITDGATEVAESATAPHTYAWSASATSPVTSGEVVTSCGSAGAKAAGSDTFASGSPATGTFACTFDDGAAGTTSTVSATLAVPGGGTATGSTTVAVDNVDPTATIAAPATALTGGRFDLSLGSPSDPSSADSTAGFTYAFDCGTGTLGAYGSSSSTSCTAPATAGDLTVKASVRDKDGGAGTYSAVVSVSAPAPVVTPDPGTSTGPGTPTPVVNPDPGATTGSGTPTPPVDARLQVTVAADVAGITAGTGVGFTVSASNPGTAAATDVRLADVLPAAAGTVWTVDPSSGAGAASCGVASGSLVCTTSSLAAGASFTARITSPTTDDTCAASPVIDSAGLSAGNVAPGTSASAQVAVDCTGTLTGTVEDSQGTPLAGSSVTACPGGVQPPPVTGLGCAAAVNTDPAGYFTIGDLPAGDYEVRILSLAGAQTVNVTVAPLTTTSTGFIHLSGRLQRLPDRLSVSTPAFGTQTAAALGSDLPNVLATEQATVEQSGACVGAVDPTFTVWAPDPGTGLQVPVPFATNLALSEVAPGDYRGTVPALGRYNGSSRIVMTLSCQGAPIDFGVYVDPSGVILDANGAPLAGATVTLLQSPSGAPGTYTPVPDGSPVMSPANRTNPWVTGADGGFGWDVVAGFYQLTASKPGCTAASSAPFAVPPALANVTLSLTCTPAPAPAPPAAAPAPAVVPTVARIAGPDRVATSVAVSQSAFAAGSATAVVLARSDLYPDGLAGGPLAAAKVGPLLLTPPRALDARTAGEIRRVLPRRATVYLLGLTDALSASVASQVSALGYSVVRIGGPDRFATSVAIAGYIGAPAALFTTTGLDFADALSVSAAASKVGGAIVLTAGPSMPGVVAAYLSAHRGLTRYAVGGPAASADPGAQAIAGADRFVTAASVATRFFPGPTALGVATADDFADALCASPVFGRLGAPVLLSQAASLPSSVSQLVGANRGSLVSVDVFGGTAAVGQSVLDGLGAALGLAPSTPSVARNLRHA
ncbi:MAG TPA: cell wall-binding repeat-containing protein, partial [Acidimicrobiales bacterium]|nr:cell wall-binding repeat-containing protein [Acidimicrobiales bacterium]